MTLKKNMQFQLGAFLTYVSIAINIVAGILYTPWMISQIGQSDYGLYTLANSLISLFLIDIGLSTATSRYVAKYRAENREEEIPKFLSAVYKIYLFIDGIFFASLLILFFCIDVIYVNLTPAELEKFKVVFCIAGFYSLINFPCVTFNGILNAYEQFIPLKVADMIQRIGTVLLTVLALLAGMGLYALVLIHAVCGLLAILIKFVFVQKKIHFRFVKHEKSIYKSVLGFSIWSCIYSLAQRLIFNITPTILGITVSTATSAIAIFGIISTIEGYCYTFTTAINGMFLSKITRLLHADDGDERLNILAINVGRFQFALNGLIVIGFALVGIEFIHLWVGASFEPAYWGILLVLLPGLFFNALQIFHTAMIAQNMVKYQALIQIIMGVCNVVLSCIFSYLWGVVGAALSIFIAYTLRLILTLILIHKKLNISLWSYVKGCYLKMAIPMIITGAIGALFIHFFRVTSWLSLVIAAVFIMIVYLLALWLSGLTRAERKSILRKLRITHKSH